LLTIPDFCFFSFHSEMSVPTAVLSEQITTLNETLTGLPGFEDGELTVMNGADSDNQWMLQSGYMVFFMQAGFAMLCAGSVRAKNAKNIILLNILDACLGSLCWWATGFAFAYGDTGNSFAGSKYFFLNNFPLENYAFWFFQFTFAATAATIVSGAVAERTKFQAYLMYEALLVLFVYPIVAHWVWSVDGWATTFTDEGSLLFGTGVYDFAGDGPVHMIGGIASLCAAWILGPRIGRFDADGKPVDMPGHNASLTLLGVFFLWFGWYGFNPGSTLLINGASGLAANVAIVTTIGAASGALSTLFISYLHSYLSTGMYIYDLLQVGNGALAGLVAVTGGCGYMRPWAGFITGVIGGFVYYGSSKLILHTMKVDDPVDAIAVHFFCGMWGLIACSAFASPELVAATAGDLVDADGELVGDGQRPYGFIMGGGSDGGKLLAAHIVYILALCAWTVGITLPFFFIIKKLGQFRVDPEVEAAGLDVSHHGGSAYPHDPTSAKGAGGMTMTPDMIDRKIEEALAKAKLSA
jgi:ammonium transporter, Amt family